MTTITCKRCGEDKPAGDMIQRAGKPARLCKACFTASFGKKNRGGRVGKGASKTLADVVEKRVSKPKPVKLNGHLEVAQTYGFRAAWEDGFLAIEQDQVDEAGESITARLLLTKDDVARISEWAGS